MSHTIPPASIKRIHSDAFAGELRRAMRKRGVGSRWVASQLGLGRTSVCHYLDGGILPRTGQAEVLAKALEWPKLLQLVTASRTSECELCGKGFVNDGGGPKRYCSAACRRVRSKGRLGVSTRTRADRAEQERDLAMLQLVDYTRAVQTMCRDCEPGGVCHVEDCALRPVSPLPCGDHQAIVPILQPAPGPYGSDANRKKTIAAIRASLAKRWAPLEAREELRERMLAYHAERRAERQQ